MFMRFGARIAGRGAIPSLRSVPVPVVVLKQFLRGSSQPDVRIERYPSVPSSPYKLAIDGAVFSGHDPREFPDVETLFRAETPVAKASLGSLEPVLVAASSDETRKNFCAVFFQLCRNLAVATDGHRLHTFEIESGDRGDFLVPKRLSRVSEGLEISGENPDAGGLTRVIEAAGWREGAMIGVNPGYLHDAVRFVNSEEVTIGISGEEHPLIIEAGTFFACVMPVRLEKGGENGRH